MAIWFQDDFNRTDEAIEASVDWNVKGGTHSFDIVSNEVAYTAGTGGIICAARINPSLITAADYYVQADIRHNGENIYGIVARSVDGAGDNADGVIAVKVVNSIRLLERDADVFFNLGDSAALTWTNGTTYNWRLEVVGFNYKVYRDDILVIERTGSLITAQGDAGIHKGDNPTGAGPHWDNFEVGDFTIPPTGIELFRRRMIMRKLA